MKMPKTYSRPPGLPAKIMATGFIAAALFLTACETPVFYRSGGLALLEGDRIMTESGDCNAAAAHYEEAAKSPSPEIAGQAAYNLAIIAREKGEGESRQRYLEQAASAGLPDAQLELAELYEKSGMPNEKVKNLYLPLVGWSASANLNLLDLAIKENNQVEAAKYANQAERLILAQIAGGDSDGGKSLLLARLYSRHGALLGEKRDAEAFYRQAIAKGNAKAAYELAKFWLAENERPSVREDAFFLMLQAAKAGNISAMKYIASAYETGEGIKADKQQALYWQEKLPATSGKKPSSTRSLPGKDKVVSLRKTKKLEEGKVMLLRARRARIGEGQERDETEAFSWFLKAAEAGEPEGQYETGLAYARGTGVEKDRKKARYWLEKAQEGGYVLAVDVLEALGKE